MRTYLVYWYHLKQHNNPHTEGYVGVTVQNDIRRRCHINGRSGGSKILNQAFKKYGEQNIIQDILHSVDNKEEAYEIEQAYRPHQFIGWNLAMGGGLPPDTTGRIDPPDVRKKRAESVRKTKLANPKPSHFKGTKGRWNDEQRKAIGLVHRGKTISEQHKQAITDKISGDKNPNAKEINLVHCDDPSKVHHFTCVKDAAESLGIPYQALRSVAQRSLKNDETSEPSRKGWIILSTKDAKNSVEAVHKAITARKERFKESFIKRSANRKSKVLE